MQVFLNDVNWSFRWKNGTGHGTDSKKTKKLFLQRESAAASRDDELLFNFGCEIYVRK